MYTKTKPKQFKNKKTILTQPCKGTKANKGAGWAVTEKGCYNQWSFEKFQRVIEQSLSKAMKVSKQTSGKGYTYSAKIDPKQSITLQWTDTRKVVVRGADSTKVWISESLLIWWAMVHKKYNNDEGEREGNGRVEGRGLGSC